MFGVVVGVAGGGVGGGIGGGVVGGGGWRLFVFVVMVGIVVVWSEIGGDMNVEMFRMFEFWWW